MSTIEALDRERTLINPLADRVKDVAALNRSRARAKRGLFLIEGPQGVREALAAHHERVLLDALYVTEDCLAQNPDIADGVRAVIGSPAPGKGRKVFVRLVAPEVMAAMSDAQTPQGVIAVVHTDRFSLSTPWSVGEWPLLVAAMVRVQDPGNAGTLIRAADAAGAGGVATSTGTVDVFNPKSVRSTAGSIVHLPVLAGQKTEDLVGRAHENGLQVLAADGRGDHDLDDLSDAAARGEAAAGVDLAKPTLWLFGNEAQGLTPQEKSLADARVAVPVYGSAESLNVATAATVCLYASARAQRVLGSRHSTERPTS